MIYKDAIAKIEKLDEQKPETMEDIDKLGISWKTYIKFIQTPPEMIALIKAQHKAIEQLQRMVTELCGSEHDDIVRAETDKILEKGL